MDLRNYALKLGVRLWKIFPIILVISTIECTRRYDIEQECIRIYHEDLKTVLMRFRRTSEYIKILNSKVQYLTREMGGIMMEVYTYHTDGARLQEGVARALGLALPTEPTTIDCAKGQRFKSRREGEEEPEMSQVDFLDQMAGALGGSRRALTASESNLVRNYAYEVAGTIIHDIIKGFYDEDEGAKSTRQMMIEYDKPADAMTTTTEHCSIHTVSPQTTTTFLPPAARIGSHLEPKFAYKPSKDDPDSDVLENGDVNEKHRNEKEEKENKEDFT